MSEPVVPIDTQFVMMVVGEQTIEIRALRAQLAKLAAEKAAEAEKPPAPAP